MTPAIPILLCLDEDLRLGETSSDEAHGDTRPCADPEQYLERVGLGAFAGECESEYGGEEVAQAATRSPSQYWYRIEIE